MARGWPVRALTRSPRDDSVQVRVNMQGSGACDSLIERSAPLRDKARFEYKRIQIGDSIQVWETNAENKEVHLQPSGTVGSSFRR